MINITTKVRRPPKKLQFLYDTDTINKYKYFLLEGGRGGGKTETLGQYFVLNSFNSSGDILCIREIQKSISDSVYKVIVEWIETLELLPFFTILKNEIVNNETGAKFIFRGLSGQAAANAIKSLKGVMFVWYEEAQTAVEDSLKMLLPTIRIDGCKFFFSMNRYDTDDIVPVLIGERASCYCVHINYTDNQYCPQTLIDEAEECKLLHPEDYDHIWLGKPMQNGSRQTVLERGLLERCIDAHKILGNSGGHSYAGLDLASGELKANDKNALSVVHGPVLMQSEEWRSGNLDMVATHTTNICSELDVIRLYYDAVGVGGFAGKQLSACNPAFSVEPYMGSHSVYGKDKPFIRKTGANISNFDYFQNLKAQMWWNMRLRIENTSRMLDGFKTVRPEYYFSIDSNVKNVDKLIAEFGQATWIENNSGKIVIDKSPGDFKVMHNGKLTRMRSPNKPDSVISAYIRSIRYGLRNNR